MATIKRVPYATNVEDAIAYTKGYAEELDGILSRFETRPQRNGDAYKSASFIYWLYLFSSDHRLTPAVRGNPLARQVVVLMKDRFLKAKKIFGKPLEYHVMPKD